jgi:hypothetical protein
VVKRGRTTIKLRGAATALQGDSVGGEQLPPQDIGDQFIALAEGRRQTADDHRHFGLVVDDKEKARLATRSDGS